MRDPSNFQTELIVIAQMADHSVTKTAELFKFSIDPVFKMMFAFKIRIKPVLACILLE